MPRWMNRRELTLLLGVVAVPVGGTAARAQQTSADTMRVRVRNCVGEKCATDTNRVVVLRLMNRVDSLQRIFLGQPISPVDRERMKAQVEDMLQKIMELQANAMDLRVRGASEAARAADQAARAAAEVDRTRSMWNYDFGPRMIADAAPKGWIGLTFVGASVEDVHDGEYFVRFLDYPEVESVEPSSPAQAAGISRGDLLLAFNGKDVTDQPISMTRLLVPEHKVVVRLRRDGQPRDYTLTVATAPRNYALRLDDFTAPRAPVAAVMGAPRAAKPSPVAPPVPPDSGRYLRGFDIAVPNPPRPGTAVLPRTGTWLSFDSEHAPVAGAEMNTLNPDLARNLNLGVTAGVMVMSVPSGSPARAAGLRSGDVVVKVAGDAVSSVRDLRRALQRHASAPTVELQVVRERHTRTLKLKND